MMRGLGGAMVAALALVTWPLRAREHERRLAEEEVDGRCQGDNAPHGGITETKEITMDDEPLTDSALNEIRDLAGLFAESGIRRTEYAEKIGALVGWVSSDDLALDDDLARER